MKAAVFLLSLSLVSLEIVWTRLFSAEFYYPFAFLTLSLAILGLGLGALAVRLLPRLLDERRVPLLLLLTSAAALAGPPLVFRSGIDFEALFGSAAMMLRFAAVVALLGSAFFFGGAALAVIFRTRTADMPRLYMADLVGAGAGAVLAVILMNAIGTQAAVFVSSLPVIAAAVWTGRTPERIAAGAVAATMALLAVTTAPLLEMKREERGPVIFKHWDAMSKLKVYDLGGYRSFNIDNLANTGTFEFDGNWNKPGREPFEFGLDVSNLIRRFPACRFLSLGAGGGGDVLQALQAGAKEIRAVEVNPQINRMLLHDDLHGYVGGTKRLVGMDEFSGRIYSDRRVKVATEDARAYVRRLNGEVDVIYSLSSNTFAALASGSFAMAENYLFTTEAFRDYWRALSPNGFLVMEHQFYMPRIVPSVIDALRASGVKHPAAHFAVYDLPKMHRNVVLLSKQPLTDDIRNTFLGKLSTKGVAEFRILHPASPAVANELVPRIVKDGWRRVAADAAVNVSPATDDRPFIGQLGLWRNLGRTDPSETPRQKRYRSLEVSGYPMSKVLLVTILGVLTAVVLPLNVLPAVKSGPKLRGVPWLYFFTIGVAFMAVEVVLIQKYTLLVGPSAYSIATILATMLLASGLGSFAAKRFGDWTPFIAIALWLVADVFVLRLLFQPLATLPMLPRMLAAALMIAPVGFFMGMPFPKAALRVGPLVDWGFAVNGAASVLGGTAILLVAFAWGFSVALAVAAGLYLVAGTLLSHRESWT